jgi:hypothetical protein
VNRLYSCLSSNGKIEFWISFSTGRFYLVVPSLDRVILYAVLGVNFFVARIQFRFDFPSDFSIHAQPSLASLPLEAFHQPVVCARESCLRASLSLATRSHHKFLLRSGIFSMDSLPGHFSCWFSLPQLAAAKSLIIGQLL